MRWNWWRCVPPPDNDLRELWEEWQRRRVALITHPDLPPEQRRTSLARSLDLSWRSPRLRDEGRRLFRLLGQLPAGIADADRAALLGDAAAEAARQLRAVGIAFARDRMRLCARPAEDWLATFRSSLDWNSGSRGARRPTHWLA